MPPMATGLGSNVIYLFFCYKKLIVSMNLCVNIISFQLQLHRGPTVVATCTHSALDDGWALTGVMLKVCNYTVCSNKAIRGRSRS